jgi:hypothetical protein
LYSLMKVSKIPLYKAINRSKPIKKHRGNTHATKIKLKLLLSPKSYK